MKELSELERQGSGEKRIIGLIRAASLLWLDSRDVMLCNLSADDGEWPEIFYPRDGKRLKRMDRLMKSMLEYARNCVEESDARDLIWAVLEEQAVLHGYTIEVNWSIHAPDALRRGWLNDKR